MINLGTNSFKDFEYNNNLIDRIDLGSTTIFDPYTELTGSLPLSFDARAAGALKDYRVYGSSTGSGETAQLGIQLDEPLRGLGDIKDTLDLSTGILTRRIGVVVLDGTTGQIPDGNTTRYFYNTMARTVIVTSTQDQLCSHYSYAIVTSGTENVGFRVTQTSGGDTRIAIRSPNTDLDTTEKYRAFYASEYANGRPVTAYYVLATPVTEQVDVPSGLAGTIEGYLTQTGTPTESNPIYPEANGVKLPNGKYEVYADVYKIPLSISDGTNTSSYDLFIGGTKLGATEYLVFSEQKIYKDVSGTLTPTDPPAPLPAIQAYKGENTLSSTETVGNVTVKGRLKAMYAPIEYIENTGSEYIATDILLKYADKVEVDTQITNIAQISEGWYLFGACNNSNNAEYFVQTDYTRGTTCLRFYIGYSWRAGNFDMYPDYTQRAILTAQHGVSSYGSTTLNTGATIQYPELTFPIDIWGLNADDGTHVVLQNNKMKIYNFKIYDTTNNVLTHDLAPVKRLSDNKQGLYDRVTGSFYAIIGV